MKFCRALRPGSLVLVLALWMSAAFAQDGAVSWRIDLDAPDEVRTLLEEHLDVYRYRGRPGVDGEMLQRLVARTSAEAGALLATAGYFSPEIEAVRIPSADIDTVHILSLIHI